MIGYVRTPALAARKLVSRQHAAQGVFLGGTALSLGLFIAGVSQASSHGDPRASQHAGVDLFLGSLATLAGTAIITMMTTPKEGDVLEVTSSWNASHPDRPFAFEPVVEYAERTPVLIGP